MNCPTCGKPAIPMGQGYWACGDHIPSREEQTNAAIARAIGKLAAALAKEARPMPAIEAEVTERDLTDRVKKFVMREV